MSTPFNASEGLVFNIQRFCLDDGPGIRTTVFLKGCPLRCAWCHNPESQQRGVQLQFFAHLCTGCGACVNACPEGVRAPGGTFHQDGCTLCGACADACPNGALSLCGKRMRVAEIADQAARDEVFYQKSGGGVTFSGGEPFMQADFLIACLAACKARGLDTAVETALDVPAATLLRAAPHIDLWLCDVKNVNDDEHRRQTGVSNRRILENLTLLCENRCNLIARMPIIPGHNDTPEHMRRTADYLLSLPAPLSVELLPFHAMASGKYQSLGRASLLEDLVPPSAEHMQALCLILSSRGLTATVSSH